MEDPSPSATIKTNKPSRWDILRRALLPPQSPAPHTDSELQSGVESISRRCNNGFNLIPFQSVENSDSNFESNSSSGSRDACLCYTLPTQNGPQILLHCRRVDSHPDLGDFEICNKYDIDNTGLVCHWPSEEVLAYYCLSHEGMFRSKNVIELGSGYGFAGLVIGVVAEASKVVISDGNPQVVDYIQRNIDANSAKYGSTTVKSMMLHWGQEEISDMFNSFDFIIASDCTFFKEYHRSLAQTVKFLLKKEGPSQALFFSPRRGNSLEMFLVEVKRSGLHYNLIDMYDTKVWSRHQAFMNGDQSWPNYEKDHCYPLLVRIVL